MGRFCVAPSALFWVNDQRRLMPLAIQLGQSPKESETIYTPKDDHWTWLMARAFVQSADGTYHEVVAHLLRTHRTGHGMRGVLVGHVRLKGDSKSEPFLVFGHWAAAADGSGKFEARVFESNDALTDHAKVGWISGAFKDPKGDEPGVFHGQWKICP